MTNLDSLMISLNPAQREAAQTLSGPLLILAGAGSGKTRVLTFRIANLIAQGLAAPDEILAVTFTNKAAREMEERTIKLLHELGFLVNQRLWISTFHSTCVRILRNHADLLDYKSFFGIYDSADQLSLIKSVLVALNIDDRVHPAKQFQGRINDAKMLGLSCEDIELGRAERKRLIMDELTKKVYRRYEDDLKKSNNMDFGDLLLKTYELFRAYPGVTEYYQNKFKYILIDEYQDTNHIQYKLISTLAAGHHNLCVVGDEDQSIYSWRGADIGNILSFEADFPECKLIKLEQNYRSSRTIVTAATELIKNNTQRKNKTLFTDNHEGALIRIQEESSEYDEARFVVREIQNLMREQPDSSYNDFAVFYRTNAQSRVLEDQLRSAGLPYKIVGGLKFYDRLEIKDMIAYMKILLNPTDDVAFKRIINTPTRGIGKTTIGRLEELAVENKSSLYEATERAVLNREFNAGTTRKLRLFIDLLAELTTTSQGLKPSEIYHLILDKTQYVLSLQKEATPESQSRLENLEEFDNAITQFEKERVESVNLQNFLEEMALVSDVDNLDSNANSVTLMTLHVSKGLEFNFVFIVGMEEGLFPSAQSSENKSGEALEEERRLAYVGMTRARQQLFMSHCRVRRMWGSENQNPPSRFLQEIPSHLTTTGSAIARPRFLDRYNSYLKPKSPQPAASTAMPDYENIADPDFSSADDQPTAKFAQPLPKGARVRHPTFGVGSIFACEGQGEAQKVSVVFADHSVKKFVVKYARLERI